MALNVVATIVVSRALGADGHGAYAFGPACATAVAVRALLLG